MRSRKIVWVFLSLVVLSGCDKVPLVRNPGEASAASPGFNRAPFVEVGSDVSIEWPTDYVQLNAVAQDDALPSTGKLRLTWMATPSGVSFDDPMSAKTIARFTAVGTYTLELAAEDGALRTTDSVTVNVLPAPQPHAAPNANAGEDFTIELPFPVTLRGTVEDDLLSASQLQVTWALVSGPGDARFDNPQEAQTSVRFARPGLYELALEVSDGEYTARDTVSIQATPAVYPAPDLSEADPDRGWLRVTPNEVGMNDVLLQQAQAYAETENSSGMIVRRGRVVRSWGSIDQRFDLKSTTKSIGSIALAMALEEQRVRLEDRAIAHLPTFGVPPATNDPQWINEITLLQLATHTSGFEKTGAYGRLLAPPGLQWRYSDGALNWLADTLTTVFAQDLHTMMAERVWPTLGLNLIPSQLSFSLRDDVRWRAASSGMRPEPRANGIQHREFASGIIANTNALSRIGLLFLRRGESRVFPETFVDLVSTPRVENASATSVEPSDYPEANLRYGVLWWTNATGALPEVPRDAYWAWGLYDSLIVVIPSLDLVITRAQPPVTEPSPGRILGDNNWDSNYEVLAPFLNPIVQAVQEQ
jgi:CubicO group peptidase (beta-lactamase class C family)